MSQQIKTLFDPSRDIYRPIEKVITYDASQEERLKREISEYIVTENIEDNLESLLSKMDYAISSGENSEVGVWVSGFYGSGKSSFTKYLGLALDGSVVLEGLPFRKHYIERLGRAQTKALVNKIARYRPVVIFLDLASEMLAGATMEDVSTVLYYKVLQWAGYSQNLIVATFEQKLEKDGRYDEFRQRIEAEIGLAWEDVKNDILVLESIVPEIAHEMYPDLFKTPSSFDLDTREYFKFEKDRVKEMLEIIRRKSGKDLVIFIVDELGQYVASRPNLILNVDGLAKNLKNLGGGKVWFMATAQQTLREDNPRAALNAPELYKLEARFPIQIDLESRDIKEISYRRLLGKSPKGEQVLGALFDQHGQKLRHNTRLIDAGPYESDFDRQAFINYYPFLPAHFDLLLFLLGELAKSTGGLGLRSALKVIQDILIEKDETTGAPLAEQNVGALVTAVTIFDALEKDIERAKPSIYAASMKAIQQFKDSKLHQDVAKTVAVLQILNNMPVTAPNIASLIHPAVDADSLRDEVTQAVEDLTANEFVPFGEKDGGYAFFSEKINDIDRERMQLPVRSLEVRRIINESIKEIFQPLPATKIQQSLTVTTGIKVANGMGTPISLAGDKNAIQTILKLMDEGGYEAERVALENDSRQPASRNVIYLLGRKDAAIEEKAQEIYRSQEIVNRYRNDADQDVRDYCNSQRDRANKLKNELARLIERAFLSGSFIFRGRTVAVSNLDDHSLKEAVRAFLDDVAEDVFSHYGDAPVRVPTSTAEKFLRGGLNAVTSETDPLGLVVEQQGMPTINTGHPALIHIKDFLQDRGVVDGRQLMAYFADAPYGWSSDTLRYLIAALLMAGEIKLNVAGRTITAAGPQAIQALRTNQAFKKVGVAVRDDRPALDVLARAAQRLTELSGEEVVPLEDSISKAAERYFRSLVRVTGSLEEKLRNLNLPGEEDVRALNQKLEDMLLTDASDAPHALGSEHSSLYEDILWAQNVHQALASNLETTIRTIRAYEQAISELPDTGLTGELKQTVAPDLDWLTQRLTSRQFYEYRDDLGTHLVNLKSAIRNTVEAMKEEQRRAIREAAEDLRRLPEWEELTREEQGQIIARLEELRIDAPADISGLKQLVNHGYSLQYRVNQLKSKVQRLGQERRRARLQEEKARAEEAGQTAYTAPLRIPRVIREEKELDALIQALLALKEQLAVYKRVDLDIEIENPEA